MADRETVMKTPTKQETPALRRCPGCGKLRMSTKGNRFHKRCRKANAGLPRLAQAAIAWLPERGEEDDD